MKHDLLLWSVDSEEEQLCLTCVGVLDDTAARLDCFHSTHWHIRHFNLDSRIGRIGEGVLLFEYWELGRPC